MSAPRINLGLLSRDELNLIRAKVAAGDVDDLDAGALLDHIDARDAAYEELVQKSGRNQRIVDLVTAKGTALYPSRINPDRVVVVNGRTGLDACEATADKCFDVLFTEEDGGESPGRIEINVAASAAGEPQ